MEQHIRVLGVLHIINGVFAVLTGMVIMFILGFLSTLAHATMQSGHMWMGHTIRLDNFLGFLALIFGPLYLLVGLPGIIGGWGLLLKKSWARILVLIVGIINLLHFPLGTALGIYTIWVLLQPVPGTSTTAT